jgi:hypothetical protein
MTAVLIDEHVHEKVFNDRIAELLASLSCAEFHLETSMSGSFMLVSSSGCVN